MRSSAEEVDDDEDAAEDEGRGEEGDEAADDDLGGAAGEPKRPAPLDEDAGELDAGDGEEEAGEDAAGAEAGEDERGRLRGGSGLEGGDDVRGGGDEAGAGGVERVGPGERLGGAEGHPQRDAAAECAVGEEEGRRVGRDETLERGPRRLGDEEEQRAHEHERERADDAVADGHQVSLSGEPLGGAGEGLAAGHGRSAGGSGGQGEDRRPIEGVWHLQGAGRPGALALCRHGRTGCPRSSPPRASKVPDTFKSRMISFVWRLPAVRQNRNLQ